MVHLSRESAAPLLYDLPAFPWCETGVKLTMSTCTTWPIASNLLHKSASMLHPRPILSIELGIGPYHLNLLETVDSRTNYVRKVLLIFTFERFLDLFSTFAEEFLGKNRKVKNSLAFRFLPSSSPFFFLFTSLLFSYLPSPTAPFPPFPFFPLLFWAMRGGSTSKPLGL